jgi:CIC family chloride channel protein
MTDNTEANRKPASEHEVAQEQVRSEIQEYLHVSQQRRRLFPLAALAGLLAGLVAIAFRAILAGGDALRNALIAWAHHYPLFGWIFPVLMGAAGATGSVFLVRRFAPEASGSGIPHLEAVLHRFRELNWKRVLPVKFFGGALGIGVGMALGREGPTVQMGGTAGAALSDWLKVGTHERLILIAAGAGAGLAAAFNAPLAGLVFVLEEVQKDFRQAVFGAAFIAAAMADIVARFASGQLPVFRIPSYPVPALSALPMFAVLGVAAGLLGVVYNRSLIATLNLFARLPPRMTVAAAALVGVMVGVAGWFNPLSIGGGHALAENILDGKVALSAILFLFALRFALSMLSYGTGAPGGIFAPLLVLGALIGLGIGKLAPLWFPGVVQHPEIFAVVGMAAYFTAIVRAPLTGIVLIIEMTGNYAQMLPLLVACFCAYVVAEAMKELPIYENLLERDLARGGTMPDLKEPMVLEMEVEPGSLFEGKEVRELGLPPGCILITCREGSREWVPTASTRMEAHLRVTAVIAPQAKDGIAVLRHGCEAAD